MRLVTANLYNGRAHLGSIARLVEAVRPDVLVGQEVGIDAAATLRSAFPHGAAEGADDHTGRALLSHDPLQVQDLPFPLRRGYTAEVVIDGREVRLYAVHIANPIDGGQALRHRRAQLEVIEALVGETGPCLVVGDMNSTPLWPFHRRLGRRLDDTIGDWARARGSRAPRTWGPTPGSPGLLRIDHVFGRGVEVIEHRVHRVEGSDHRAVEVELRAIT